MRLHVLEVKWGMREFCSEFSASIHKMHQLISLAIWAAHEQMDRTPALLDPEVLHLPPSLMLLLLKMQLQRIPSSLSSHSRLAKLTLMSTSLIEDPIVSLRSFPNLSYLYLEKAYTGKHIGGCSRGSFPSLRNLVILDLNQWEEWGDIEEGSFPCLSYLRIYGCLKLKMLPQGFQRLVTLRHLKFSYMPEVFMNRLKPHEGADPFKIQHIPLINIT
ncbi:hypothetical protein AMTRI_Chr10g7900 [Amborella trichopoda]